MSTPNVTTEPFLAPPLLDRVATGTRAALITAGVASKTSEHKEVFEEDNRGFAVAVLLSGWVALDHRDPDGESVSVGICGPGSLLNDATVLGATKATPAVRALTDVHYRLIAAPDFRRLVSVHPDLLHGIATTLSDRLRESAQARRDFLSLEADVRVARTIVRLSTYDPRASQWGLPRMITRPMLCSLSSTKNRTLEMAYRHLREAKILAPSHRRTVILDMPALRAWGALPPH